MTKQQFASEEHRARHHLGEAIDALQNIGYLNKELSPLEKIQGQIPQNYEPTTTEKEK